MNRKKFFLMFDPILPRWLALLPYQVCLYFIKTSDTFSACKGFRVWNRNSTRLNYFIMGISDLDLTILTSQEVDISAVNHQLRLTKKIFPYLGEVNLYQTRHLPLILARANVYELQRDPEIAAHRISVEVDDNVEKFVFLVRMLFSDVHTLITEKESRQRKWAYHAKMLGFEKELPLSIDNIHELLIKLIPEHKIIQQSLKDWIEALRNSSYEEFKSNLGEGFKIVAPHKNIWQANPEYEKRLLSNLAPLEKRIMKRQIDWEIWGIYSQKFWLEKSTIKIHLERLIWVYEMISSESEIRDLKEAVKLIID